MLLTLRSGQNERVDRHELHISMSTVKSNLTGLMTKLGARNRVGLAI